VGVISSTTAPYPDAVSAVTGLGATTVTKTIGTPSPNPASIVTREFKRDLNAYLGAVPGPGAKSLQAIIDYDNANPVEGLKYQQGELTAAQAVNLGDPATQTSYNDDKTNGLASNKALIDGLLNNGTPADTTDDVEVMMVPSGNALVGIADRAGYPVITVPAGYGTGSAGRNPIGVTFVGGPFSEATLLADAYAYEQATGVRDAPSVTNPSMWRCVPGSKFFSPHHCHPGDLMAPDVFPSETTPTPTPTPTTPTETPTTPTTTSDSPTATTPAVVDGPPAIPLVESALPLKLDKVASTHSSLRLTVQAPGPGSLVATTKTSYRSGGKTKRLTLGRASAKPKAAGPVHLRIKFSAAGMRALKAAKTLKVALRVSFKPAGGTATVTKKTVEVSWG
jgi:hypothetical protein